MGGSDVSGPGGGGRFGPGDRLGGTSATRQGAVRDAFGGGLDGGRDGGEFPFGRELMMKMFGNRFGGFGDKDGKRKGSNRHISTAPTKNPYANSLLGDTALASTAAPTLLS